MNFIRLAANKSTLTIYEFCMTFVLVCAIYDKIYGTAHG